MPLQFLFLKFCFYINMVVLCLFCILLLEGTDNPGFNDLMQLASLEGPQALLIASISSRPGSHYNSTFMLTFLFLNMISRYSRTRRVASSTELRRCLELNRVKIGLKSDCAVTARSPTSKRP